MAGLIKVLKTTGIIAATGLSCFGGIELGERIAQNVPEAYLLPELTQGTVAYISANIGNGISKWILYPGRLSNTNARSIAALNAFANSKNDDRGISCEESLSNLSDNLVQVRVETDSKSSLGSGLLITTGGYVLKSARISIKNQRNFVYHVPLKDVSYNSHTDIAVLKAKTGVIYSEPIRARVDLEGEVRKGEGIRILGFRDGQKYNTMGVITHPGLKVELADRMVYDLFLTDARGKEGQSGGIIASSDGSLKGIVVFSSKSDPGEEIGYIGGAKISNALNYINQIASERSSRMFRH